MVITGWAISAAVALAIIYGLSAYLHADDEMTTATRIFYGSLHRTAWAMALSWVIFACTKGYGGQCMCSLGLLTTLIRIMPRFRE